MLFDFQSHVFGQTCGSGTPPIEGLGFPHGSTVPVYIDPAIAGDRRNAVIQAFNNWQTASSANGSGITFNFVSQPPPPNTGITVNNQSPLSGDRAHTDVVSNDNNGYAMYATIQITPDMTNPPAVLEAMAHEIGHVYGLGHCPTCSPSDSVMATPGYSDPNQVTGRATSPTPCDTQAVSSEYIACDISQQNACYYSGGIWNEAACSCDTLYGGGGGGDTGEGESHYSEFCTPYYWYDYQSSDGGQTWNLVNVSYAGCW